MRMAATIISHAEMAMDADGKFLATVCNMRIWAPFCPLFRQRRAPPFFGATLLAGRYTTPQIHIEVDAWFTNTSPVDASRWGAGRPRPLICFERLVSRCAWEMNLVQAEIPASQPSPAFLSDASGAAA